MSFLIKNLGLTLCCIYYFSKLLRLSRTKETIFQNSIVAILLATFSILTEQHLPYLTTLFLILFIVIFNMIQTKLPLSVCCTATTIAFALSYTTLSLSSIILSSFFMNIFKENTQIIFQSLCCVLQLLIMHIPFRIKRIKSGMPFLYNYIYAIPGMIISILILLVFTYMTYISFQHFSIYHLIPIIILGILAFLIYHYWQQNLTKTYRDKLNERNLEDLNKTISSQSERIEMLEQENARLAKIIHKDNKLIPAMEYAVRTFIQSNSVTTKDKIVTGEKLLEELSTLSSERKGILHQQNMNCQQLDLTNVASIDHLLNYFQGKANENNIEFQSIISCDVQYLVEHIISEDDLKTLLADLLENARIATKYNNGRYILLSMSIVSNTYTISVFDSGIPFTTDVIEKWGLEQITTHADDEGSGIGMLTTYEILKKYKANFIIHELSKDNRTYTKEITVSFNKRNQYILQTNRPEEELIKLSKRADLQIIRQ